MKCVVFLEGCNLQCPSNFNMYVASDTIMLKSGAAMFRKRLKPVNVIDTKHPLRAHSTKTANGAAQGHVPMENS